MGKLIQYIFVLIVMLSCVYITKEVIEFKKDVILIEDFRSSSAVKRDRMLRPSVKITMVTLGGLEYYYNSNEIEEPAQEDMFQDLNFSATSASGFSIKYDPSSDRSYIVTNDHFCSSGGPLSSIIIEVSSRDSLGSNSTDLAGEIVYTDPSLDLCLIAAEGFVSPAIVADYGYNPMEFERVYVVGAPSGNFPIILETYISGFLDKSYIPLGDMATEGFDHILISESTIPGHSGSAVYNEKGEVIGVIFASMGSYGGIAISHRDVFEMLRDANISL